MLGRGGQACVFVCGWAWAQAAYSVIPGVVLRGTGDSCPLALPHPSMMDASLAPCRSWPNPTFMAVCFETGLFAGDFEGAIGD